MPELIPTAGEAAWLAARRAGITASEIAVILGLSPYSSPYALYHQKLGILDGQDDSAMMERGRVLEPHIASKFREAHPEFYVAGDGRALWSHSERPWMMATPDRLVHDYQAVLSGPAGMSALLAVLECKVDGGSDEWGEEGTDEIPVHYRCQAIWQMDVMGVSRAHVACLDPARWRIREYAIEHAGGCGPGRNMLAYPSLACTVCDDLAVMLGAAGEFRIRLRDGDPPDVDWRPATADALKKLHPAVEDTDVEVGRMPIIRYRAACKALKAAEQRKKEAENRLRLLLGSGHRIVSAHTGEVIARRDVYDVKAHERKASTVDKLVPVYPKKEKKNVSPDGK